MKTFGLVLELPRPEDYILGSEAKLGGSQWTKLIKEEIVDGERTLSWKKWEPEAELQRKATETNACVSFSGNNGAEYLVNLECERDKVILVALESVGLMKNGKFNASDRRTAKGSGTNPNEGNTVRAVDDYIRHNLFCPEDLWPFAESMGVDEYYAVMPAGVADYGKKVKPILEFETKYVPVAGGIAFPVSSVEQLWDALQYSPVWVSVDGGNYQQVANYTHRVIIRASVWGKYWEIHDSYQNQIVQLPWDYRFGGAKAFQIIKKNLPEFIQVGPAILFLAKSGIFAGQYVGYGDGDVAKAIEGAYPKPRTTLDNIPKNYAGSLFIK